MSSCLLLYVQDRQYRDMLIFSNMSLVTNGGRPFLFFMVAPVTSNGLPSPDARSCVDMGCSNYPHCSTVPVFTVLCPGLPFSQWPTLEREGPSLVVGGEYFLSIILCWHGDCFTSTHVILAHPHRTGLELVSFTKGKV